MKGQEMTYETKTGPLSEAQASITSIGGTIHSRLDALAVDISNYDAYAGNRKTLRL